MYQKFEFGQQKPCLNRKGQETTRADWGLVAACEWWIEGPDGFLLGSGHFYPVRRDDQAHAFYESLDTSPPVVEAVDVLENGALRMRLSGGYSLSLDPDPPCEDQFMDWVLERPTDDPRGDLFLEPHGLEWRKPTP